MVEMTVHRVGLCTQDGTPVIVLRELRGERFMPVRVSSLHANAVMRHRHPMPPFRPQSHEVFVAVVEALGAAIAGAYIEAMDENEFTAYLKVTRGTQTATLPASAADAVVLAVRSEAPIFVAPALLDKFAKPHPPEQEPQAELHPCEDQLSAPPESDVFRRFVDELTNIDDLGH